MAKPIACRDLVIRDEVEGALVFLADSDRVLRTNRTGTAILRLCNGERSVDEIAAALAREFGATRDETQEDVAEYLAELRKLGLIHER